jgi:hypothetical protein
VAETRAGRLIAVDGAVGRDVSEAATALYDCLTERRVSAGVSRWDASGLFTDVASAPVAQRDISPRTLLLLYAADLAFRIRWEIAPALEQGLVIVAAPYVTTAMTFGRATGRNPTGSRRSSDSRRIRAGRSSSATASRSGHGSGSRIAGLPRAARRSSKRRRSASRVAGPAP